MLNFFFEVTTPPINARGSGPSPKTLARKLYTFVLIWFHKYFMNSCWISSLRGPLPQSRCEGEWSLKKRWLGNTFVLVRLHKYFMNLCLISSMRGTFPQSRCEGEWSPWKYWLWNTTHLFIILKACLPGAGARSANIWNESGFNIFLNAYIFVP